MTGQPGRNRFLKVIGLVVLSVAVLFTLLGGIGTSCVAFAPANWGPSMTKLAPVQGIFIALVVVSLAAGVAGVAGIVGLARHRTGAYRLALIALAVGLVASAVQYYFSATLRGSTAPNNIRLYATVLALAVLLLFRLPPLWQRSGFDGSSGAQGGGRLAGGAALCLCGSLTLLTSIWAGPSHIVDGYNTVQVLGPHLLIVGGVMVGGGLLLLLSHYLPILYREFAATRS